MPLPTLRSFRLAALALLLAALLLSAAPGCSQALGVLFEPLDAENLGPYRLVQNW